jgi:hypothetical protein
MRAKVEAKLQADKTIYQSTFVQGRGALRHQLHVCLRSGRAMRRNQRWTKGGHGGPRSSGTH